MIDFLELVEKLKAATGPDRILDAKIAHATKFPHLPVETDGEHAGYLRTSTGWLMVSAFTSSIDDAIKLVPPGCNWLVGKGKTRLDEPKYGAQVQSPYHADWGDSRVIGEGESDGTAAIAICIAALEAAIFRATSLTSAPHPTP